MTEQQLLLITEVVEWIVVAASLRWRCTVPCRSSWTSARRAKKPHKKVYFGPFGRSARKGLVRCRANQYDCSLAFRSPAAFIYAVAYLLNLVAPFGAVSGGLAPSATMASAAPAWSSAAAAATP